MKPTQEMIEAALAAWFPWRKKGPWADEEVTYMETTLTAALAAMPGEPVAWLHEDFQKEMSCYDQATAFPNDRSGGGFRFVPLYLAPPPPADKAEIERLREALEGLMEFEDIIRATLNNSVADEALAALKGGDA